MLLYRLVLRPALRLGALIAALALIAGADPARAEFMGAGAIYAPYNCSWPTGTEMTRARYRPSEDGEDFSQLTLNFAVGGVNHFMVRGPMAPGTGWRQIQGRAVWGGFYFMPQAPQIQVIERVGAPGVDVPFEGADTIRFRARIRNFNGQRGCAVSVVLMMHRWD